MSSSEAQTEAQGGQPLLNLHDSATLRSLITRVLRQHPAGLNAGEIASQLGSMTSLTPTLKAMERDGLLRRVAFGGYAIVQAQ
jgi:hypothetical protein